MQCFAICIDLMKDYFVVFLLCEFFSGCQKENGIHPTINTDWMVKPCQGILGQGQKFNSERNKTTCYVMMSQIWTLYCWHLLINGENVLYKYEQCMMFINIIIQSILSRLINLAGHSHIYHNIYHDQLKIYKYQIKTPQAQYS